MKRTGVKKLELKRLTVKQLTEVAGSGHRIQTRGCSDTCQCATSGVCNTGQAGMAADDNGYWDCDYAALNIGGCAGDCRYDDGDFQQYFNEVAMAQYYDPYGYGYYYTQAPTLNSVTSANLPPPPPPPEPAPPPPVEEAPPQDAGGYDPYSGYYYDPYSGYYYDPYCYYYY